MTSSALARAIAVARAGVQRGARSARRWRANTRTRRAPNQPAPINFVVSGGLEQLYQTRQWIWPLEQLAQRWPLTGGWPVRLLVRDSLVALELQSETHLPVVHARTTRELGELLGRGALVALYPNQATLNFQALAAPRPAHVHLSHGESEKISMVSNQLKAYDFIFTAGAAARERIARHLIGFDDEHCVDVGRPQLDEPRSTPTSLPPTDRRTILYAPTWEGDSAAMSYSSLAGSGVDIVSHLVSSGYRVIYRPHPQSGTRSESARRAHSSIVKILAETGQEHYVDTGAAIGWQFDAADGFVMDVSAMAYDALTAGKPLVVFRPADGAHLEADGLLQHIETFDAQGVADVSGLLGSAGSDSSRARRARLSVYHFGDTAPGRSLERFIGATLDVARQRERALGLQESPRGTDEEK